MTERHLGSRMSHSILHVRERKPRRWMIRSLEVVCCRQDSERWGLTTCGTEQERFRLSQVLVDFIGDGNLSVCK